MSPIYKVNNRWVYDAHECFSWVFCFIFLVILDTWDIMSSQPVTKNLRIKLNVTQLLNIVTGVFTMKPCLYKMQFISHNNDDDIYVYAPILLNKPYFVIVYLLWLLWFTWLMLYGQCQDLRYTTFLQIWPPQSTWPKNFTFTVHHNNQLCFSYQLIRSLCFLLFIRI